MPKRQYDHPADPIRFATIRQHGMSLANSGKYRDFAAVRTELLKSYPDTSKAFDDADEQMVAQACERHWRDAGEA